MRLSAHTLPEKRRLELYAAIYFIAAYRRHTAEWMTLIDIAEPPEPDFVIRRRGTSLGLEIAHLFGSERDARALLARPQEAELDHEARIQHAMVPLSDRLPADLGRILAQKATKMYARPTLLMVRNAYPLWGRQGFLDVFDRIPIPKSHPFEEIWLLCDDTGRSGLLRLA